MKINRRQLKKERTRTDIMHSAKELFEQRGLGNVNIEEITDNADVSRSTFFLHFDGMDNLHKALADQEIRDLLNSKDQSNLSGVESLINILKDLVIDTYHYPSLTMELLIRGILRSTPDDELSKFFDQISTQLKTVDLSNSYFTKDESVAVIFGCYFGAILIKMIEKSEFKDPKETNDLLDKVYNVLLNKGGNN